MTLGHERLVCGEPRGRTTGRPSAGPAARASKIRPEAWSLRVSMAQGSRLARVRGCAMRRWVLFALLVLVVLPATASAETCSPWTQRTIASGLGSLENLAFD